MNIRYKMLFKFRHPLLFLVASGLLISTPDNLLLAERDKHGIQTRSHAHIMINTDRRDGLLNERYLGVAIDTAQFVARGDERRYYSTACAPRLEDPRLIRLASHLAPSILRIGGTDADGTYFCDQEGKSEIPESYLTAYRSEKYAPGYWTRKDIRRIADFAEAINADIMFCLNFGPGPRDPETGAWEPDNARELIRFTRSLPNGDRFKYWEAGNEVNGLFFNFRMLKGFEPKRYAEDLATLRMLLDEEHPDAILSAPASYFYPLSIVGDPLRFTARTLKVGRDHIDIVNWHLYATQGDRCGNTFFHKPFPATAENLFNEKIIRTSRKYARYVKRAADGKPVFIGETASAQCGGQKGVSNTILDALWFADWIGIMVQEGTSTIIRQTLVGFNYGIVDSETYEPFPTLLAMTMYKRLVGRARLYTQADRSLIKAHGFCGARGQNAITAVISNPGPNDVLAKIMVADGGIIKAVQWTISSPDGLYGTSASIEGKFADMEGNIPDPPGSTLKVDRRAVLADIAPESIAFILLELEQAPQACQ